VDEWSRTVSDQCLPDTFISCNLTAWVSDSTTSTILIFGYGMDEE
jgi:hypothetical protein